MSNFSQEAIDSALATIPTMTHWEMANIWRVRGRNIYLQDPTVAPVFEARLRSFGSVMSRYFGVRKIKPDDNKGWKRISPPREGE